MGAPAIGRRFDVIQALAIAAVIASVWSGICALAGAPFFMVKTGIALMALCAIAGAIGARWIWPKEVE